MRSARHAEYCACTLDRIEGVSAYAHRAFMTGDDENKKRVIRTLSYNLTLKDKVLQLEAKKWLIPIAEGYPELEAKYLEVITSNNPSTKDKTAALATVSSQWWSIVNVVRTAIRTEAGFGDSYAFQVSEWAW